VYLKVKLEVKGNEERRNEGTNEGTNDGWVLLGGSATYLRTRECTVRKQRNYKAVECGRNRYELKVTKLLNRLTDSDTVTRSGLAGWLVSWVLE